MSTEFLFIYNANWFGIHFKRAKGNNIPVLITHPFPEGFFSKSTYKIILHLGLYQYSIV